MKKVSVVLFLSLFSIIQLVAGPCGDADANGSVTIDLSDPEGNPLSYSWPYYSEPSSGSSPSISGSSSSSASVSLSSGTAHIILKVSDNGSPSLCAYRRVVIRVN